MPIQPGPMGWGEDTDTIAQRKLREQIALAAGQNQYPQRFTAPVPKSNEVIENELKKLFEFDDGFLFTVLEDMVYGTKGGVDGVQTIGDCVGFSHCMMLAARLAYEIMVEGDPEQVFGTLRDNSPVPYVPYSYGAGRVYIGGNRIRGDGSLCEWQIQASMEHGFLPCSTEGLQGPFPNSTERIERDFGSNQRTLDKWKPEAMKYDLLNSWEIKSLDAARDAVRVQRAPLQICSDWGFDSAGRDSRYGIEIYRRKGNWAHSMQIIGMFDLKGSEFTVVRNQWGRNIHKAPGAGVPAGCFIIPSDLFGRWISDAVVMAIGELQGRELDLNAPQV